MRLYGVIALAAIATFFALFSGSTAKNSTFGYIGPRDRLLYRDYAIVKSKWLQVVTKDVVFPRGFVNYSNITGIRAIDRARKNGGNASLISGGPNTPYAKLHLKSERGSGLNFTIEIYTKP